MLVLHVHWIIVLAVRVYSCLSFPLHTNCHFDFTEATGFHIFDIQQTTVPVLSPCNSDLWLGKKNKNVRKKKKK